MYFINIEVLKAFSNLLISNYVYVTLSSVSVLISISLLKNLLKGST